MQNDLILDYCSNVALYPEFQKYLRDNQPPFPLESHHTEIARLMKGFLKRVLYFPSLYSSGVMAVRRLKYLEKKAGLGKLRSSEI